MALPLTADLLDYTESGSGAPIVFLHGVLMSGSVWDPVVERLHEEFRCIVPTLPLGAHVLPVPVDTDLSLDGYGHLVLDFLDELDLHNVTLVGNDHAAILAAAVLPSDRVTRLVITSCEAFENYPPGLPGKNLRITALLPGGLLLIAHLLRIRALRRLPLTFGWLSKKPLADDLIDAWIRPLRTDADVRRDLRRYVVGARRTQLEKVCAELADVSVPTLIIWTPDDRIQRPDHGLRLARIMPNALLELVEDSYTLLMRDQPDRTAELIRGFIDRHRSDSER